MHVVATAGHVDHGKSTLVHALTGVDPDRLAEEKARGLTIDLGFAGLTLPSGRQLAFVDVPGHVRFLKNMLAGVGAVDACLLVVAATEGWKPQSEEHLRILELLGMRHGLVALTKVGLVDRDDRELAQLEVADHLAGTFLEGAEVVEVDAPSSEGLDDLRSGLDRLLATTPPAPDRGRPRLWIDRSFAPAGAGTVVTGTLTGGAFRIDDELLLLPQRAPVRVRGLQTLHDRRSELPPGHRAAINVVGVGHDRVRRGDVLVRAGQWHETRVFDASLHVLASLDHEVGRRGAYLAYLGSGEHPVRVRVLGDRGIAPGATGLVRLHLGTPLPLLPGDRYVLRESGRAETVGGGEVLDVDPVLPAARARPDRSIERVVAERGWIRADRLELLTGVRRVGDVGEWVVDPGTLAERVAALESSIDSAGPLGIETGSLDERDRLLLDRLDVVVEGGRVRPGMQADPLAGHPFVSELESSPFSPPAPDSVDRAELRELVRRGLVVEQDGVYFAASAIDRAADAVARLLRDKPEGVTVGEVRDLLGCTRKHAVPLLTRLDASGITRRRGDLRIAGPRLPAPD